MKKIAITPTIELLQSASQEILSPRRGIMIPSWDNFNLFTGGLRPNEFTIFCGSTGVGKTLMLANLAAGVVDAGEKIFVAPVETGDVNFVKRVLSVYAKEDFTFGDDLNVDQMKSLTETLEKSAESLSERLVVSNYDGRVDVDEMIELLDFAHNVHEAKVAVLDNLNFFLKPTTEKNMIAEMDEAVHKFVMYCKRTPMHVILVMHPRKTVDGKVISEFDIKGSSTAVQEATNVLLMNRLNSDDLISTGLSKFDREFVFKKIRHRGRFVDEKFYLRNHNGRYAPIQPTTAAYGSRSDKPFASRYAGKKRMGNPSIDT